MTPDEWAAFMGRQPVPYGVIPDVALAPRDRDHVARACAGVDNVGLERLLGCGFAAPIARALREERLRRVFAGIEDHLDGEQPGVYGGHTSTEARTA